MMNPKHLLGVAALIAIALQAGPTAAAEEMRIQIASATIRDKMVEGATVVLRKGGTEVTAESDQDGVATFSPAPFGGTDDSSVQLRVEKSGFSTLYGRCPCNGMLFAASERTLKGGGIRIVLNWGAEPRDLDAHLIFGGNDVYFAHPSAPGVFLDIDDTNGFGPETITIKDPSPGQQYIFAVHDFTNQGDRQARGWAASRAKVFVYVGNRLVRSAYVTPKSVGNVWVLFRVDGNGTLFDIDEFTSAQNAQALASYVSSKTWSVETGADACGALDAACESPGFTFAPQDLPFPVPKDAQPGMPYYSAPFFAVMLDSRLSEFTELGTPCRGFFSEAERSKAQAKLTGNRVFASRMGCATSVGYSNTNRAYEFMAVYAGKTKDEAKRYLKKVKGLGLFKGANLRKMQVVVRK